MTRTLFIISSFVLQRIKPVIWVWNDMRVSKWWQIFHFERTNPLKSCPLPAAITYVEQNQVNHQQKPCIYLAMTFLFSMVSVMVIDLGQIKHFFLQWMIPVSYLRFLYLSVWSCEGQVLKAWHLFPLQHFLTWMLILEHLFLFSPACTASITETKPLSIGPC